MNITLVDVAKLKEHEDVQQQRVEKIKKSILATGRIHKPIIVDRKTMVILDGHTRVTALKQIGVRRAPVYFVNYYDKHVRVYLRRKNMFMKLLKDAVLQMGISTNTFPARTTMNLISERPKQINMKLEKLLYWRS